MVRPETFTKSPVRSVAPRQKCCPYCAKANKAYQREIHSLCDGRRRCLCKCWLNLSRGKETDRGGPESTMGEVTSTTRNCPTNPSGNWRLAPMVKKGSYAAAACE